MKLLVLSSSSSSSLKPSLRARHCSRKNSAGTIVIIAICCTLFVLPTTTIVSGFVPFPSSLVPATNNDGLLTSKISKNDKKNKHANRKITLKYNEGVDSPSDNHRPNSGRPAFNAWNVLSDTETWISKTLNSNSKKRDKYSNTGNKKNTPPGSKVRKSNPYTRKEISFFCEGNTDSLMIVANIFRRLREIREQGEKHAQEEERRRNRVEKEKSTNNHSSVTFRQTQVIVIPWNKIMNRSFHVFNNCVNAINEARRNSRDLVTDTFFQKDDVDGIYNDQKGTSDWIISVSCAHLHPDFESESPAKISQETKKKRNEEEGDNLQEYKKKQLLARRSPYPTIVMEVKSIQKVPPQASKNKNDNDRKEKLKRRKEYEEFGSFLSKKDYSNNRNYDEIKRKKEPSDVQKLEALFNMPAYIKTENNIDNSDEIKEGEDQFYDSIGKTSNIQEITSMTPMSLAQHWITQQTDPNDYANTLSSFTMCNTRLTDEAFEFVFINLAMQLGNAELEIGKEKKIAARRTADESCQKQQHSTHIFRQHLVMPSFLSSSATSLEKFTDEIQKIINALPLYFSNYSNSSSTSSSAGGTIDAFVGSKIVVSNLHPEHIDPNKRSPVPMIVLQLQL